MTRPVTRLVTRLRRRAAAVLWAEALAGAVAPAVGVLCGYLALALFGLGNAWLFLLGLLTAGVALSLGLRRLRRPKPGAVDARIEAASGLAHRPLAALADTPEGGDGATLALWQAHQARSRVALQTARAGGIVPFAAAADPFALRFVLALALFIGAVTAGPAAPGRLTAVLALPGFTYAGPQVTAWVTPPAYTAQPPAVLAPGQTIIALAGANVTLITNGPRAAPPVWLAGTRLPDTPLGPAGHRADGRLTQSGMLTVGPWWHRLAQWQVAVRAPDAPALSITGVDIVRRNILAVHFHVTDSYGMDRLNAIISAAGHPAALGFSFPLPSATGDATVRLDLSESPFFGLPVTLSLAGRNAAGRLGSADWTPVLVLPGLALHDATAIQLNLYRQALALEPLRPRTVAGPLQKTSMAPPSAISASADVQMAALACAMWLREAGTPAAMQRLLLLAKEIDAGPDFVPARQLAQADQALTAQLERGLQGQAPDPATLAGLLKAMQDALARHLAAILPRQDKSAGQEIDTSALDRLAQRIAADEAAGKTAQAAQELRQLEQVLAALQSARPMTAQQAAAAQAAAAGAQQISRIAKAEGSLLNQTGQGNATPGEQQALQNQLDGTTRSLGDAGIRLPGLGPAKNAMGAAQSALGKQDTPTAQAQETAAIQALQQAAAALAKAQGSQIAIGQGGQPAPGGQDADGLNGMTDEQPEPGFDLGAGNPAGAVEQQIIKDDSNPRLPPATHQYYHRLLDGGTAP